MNRKIIFAIIIFLITGFTLFDAFGVGKFFRIRGDFTPSETWTGGHPGRVLFDIGTTNSGYAAGVDADGYLSGYFWLGNVGWATFSHSGTLPRARILCSNSVFNDPTILCPVDGYAWSENAGWIGLSGSWIASGGPGGVYSTGVYYNPSSGRIEGFGHSSALGWVPFYADAGATGGFIASGATSQSGVLFNGVGLNFIGNIAIIGNIAGTRIYNVLQQQVGFVFTTINQADMYNIVRKNIALITRNANPANMANTSSSFNFLLRNGTDYDTTVGGWTWPAGKRSIIIIGGDVILGASNAPNWIGSDTDTKRAIIALKDDAGNGGNIIIKDDVKRIYALLYAEGTIYSGEKVGSTIIPYVGTGVWNIPGNQLYLKGAMISKNTIGGSLQTPPTCPVVIQGCTASGAQIYDVNYFRTYDPTDSSQKSVPYNDPRFGAASMIIEFNPDLTNDPPPGIQNILQ